MRNDAEIGVQVGEILLPNETVDLNKWAVIACDQFTSRAGVLAEGEGNCR